MTKVIFNFSKKSDLKFENKETGIFFEILLHTSCLIISVSTVSRSSLQVSNSEVSDLLSKLFFNVSSFVKLLCFPNVIVFLLSFKFVINVI